MKYIKKENSATENFGKDPGEERVEIKNGLCSEIDIKPDNDHVDMNSSSETEEQCCLRCNICDATFENLLDCLKHEKTHAVKCFLCNICNATFENSYDLKEHKRNHNSEENSSGNTYFHCEICDTDFTKYIDIKKHNKNFHASDKQDYPKFSDYILEKHKEKLKIVTNETELKCNICHQTFSKSYNLKRHQLEDHIDEKITGGTQINQNNSDEENLHSYNLRKSPPKKIMEPVYHTFHSEINKSLLPTPIVTPTATTNSGKSDGGKSFLCNICNKTFAAAIHLSNHKKVHTKEKPYSCKYCEKTFSQVANVQVHERIHTGVKPFQCNYCEKAFTQLANLQIHERTHTGVKPFQCSFCDKKFTQLANVKIHERIHTGNKPFQCNRCNRAFRQLNHLQKHEKIHDN